jgi:hypothetical protein
MSEVTFEKGDIVIVSEHFFPRSISGVRIREQYGVFARYVDTGCLVYRVDDCVLGAIDPKNVEFCGNFPTRTVERYRSGTLAKSK